MSCIYNFMPKFSPHGRNIIFIAILATLFISIFSPSIGFIAALISSFCLYFFRDPDRKCFQKNGLIISSADGLITFIGEVEVPEKFGSFFKKLGRFNSKSALVFHNFYILLQM